MGGAAGFNVTALRVCSARVACPCLRSRHSNNSVLMPPDSALADLDSKLGHQRERGVHLRSPVGFRRARWHGRHPAAVAVTDGRAR